MVNPLKMLPTFLGGVLSVPGLEPLLGRRSSLGASAHRARDLALQLGRRYTFGAAALQEAPGLLVPVGRQYTTTTELVASIASARATTTTTTTTTIATTVFGECKTAAAGPSTSTLATRHRRPTFVYIPRGRGHNGKVPHGLSQAHFHVFLHLSLLSVSRGGMVVA